MLVFPSASHFVRHCTRLDSRPSSRHYGSLYINGVAWPNLFQGAQDKEQPNGAAPAIHRRRPSRHLQPSEANGIQGGAEREEKGKEKVHGPLAHLFISHLLVTVDVYSCCRLTDRFLPAQEPAVALVGEPTTKRNSAGGHTVPSSATASTNLNTAQEYGQRHHTYES